MIYAPRKVVTRAGIEPTSGRSTYPAHDAGRAIRVKIMVALASNALTHVTYEITAQTSDRAKTNMLGAAPR